MEVPDWFKEEWIDSDAKALGVYMALLFTRFTRVIKLITEEWVRKEISRFLEKGLEQYEALESAEAFLESLYNHQYDGKKFRKETDTILDNIESKYYDKFRRACYRFYRKEYVEKLKDNKEILRKLLTCVRLNFEERTHSGSVRKIGMDLPSVIYELLTGRSSSTYYSLPNEERKKQGEMLEKLIKAMYYSGILWFGKIVPAPFLEDEFIEKLAPPVPEPARTEVREVKIPVRKYEGKTPTREVLEGIVRDVLEDLGFKVEVNKRLRARGSGEIEVDVWGVKMIGNTRFYVYASCKNWNREVDRPVIDEEFGRTLQLIQTPHLKILVTKGLTGPAKETALADGFIVIELGEKATTDNAKEIYDIIYRRLRELFIGVAPPELQKFAKEAKEISERLKSLAEEIERVSSQL